MTPVTPVEFTFDWKDVDQTVASKALAHNFNPKWWQSLALLLTGLALATLVSGGPDWLDGPISFLIGIYACIIWNWLRYRRMTAGIRNAPTRRGGVTVTLGQDGYRAHTALTKCWSAWSTVSAIKPAKGMIILAIGDVEYIPFLDSALPDGMTREEMITLLEDFTGLSA